MALGWPDRLVLLAIELPLALPTLLAGAGTAAVIRVGTATLAAFRRAGGVGQRIVAGLAVNDTPRMLSRASPAAALALVVQAVFGALERRMDERVCMHPLIDSHRTERSAIARWRGVAGYSSPWLHELCRQSPRQQVGSVGNLSPGTNALA
jgi:hypothetical protein